MFFFKVILLKIENLQTTDSKIAINVLKGSKTKTSEDKASGQYVSTIPLCDHIGRAPVSYTRVAARLSV
jgi:hypothetical protein